MTNVDIADKKPLRHIGVSGGELLSVTFTPAGGCAPAAERTYCGAFVFEGDSLAMVNFGGGGP